MAGGNQSAWDRDADRHRLSHLLARAVTCIGGQNGPRGRRTQLEVAIRQALNARAATIREGCLPAGAGGMRKESDVMQVALPVAGGAPLHLEVALDRPLDAGGR